MSCRADFEHRRGAPISAAAARYRRQHHRQVLGACSHWSDADGPSVMIVTTSSQWSIRCVSVALGTYAQVAPAASQRSIHDQSDVLPAPNG